jgi:hypothetical protein
MVNQRTSEGRVAASSADLPQGYMDAPLSEVDSQIQEVLGRELERQRNTLEMIAPENFVPRAVLEAVGSVLTNRRRSPRSSCRAASTW